MAALCAHLFISGNSKVLSCLPPTEDAFKQHLLRSLSATLVQKRAHIAAPDLPSAIMFGWKMGEKSLEPVTMLLSPLPELAHCLTSCRCVGSKCTRTCSCEKLQVPCSVACKCEGKEDKCIGTAPLRTLVEHESSDESD